MPQIIITKRDKKGVQAKIEIDGTVKAVEHLTDEQFAEMILEAEMYGNSRGEVRVHFNGF